MSEILQNRLLETSREELGGTYGINATPGYERVPNPTYSITVQFGSAPDRTENLIKRVFQEIELFKTNGPTDKQLSDEKETLRREVGDDSKLHISLVVQLNAHDQNSDDIVPGFRLCDPY